eukprot:6866117-Pyramimonas_sp.AAC.1
MFAIPQVTPSSAAIYQSSSGCTISCAVVCRSCTGLQLLSPYVALSAAEDNQSAIGCARLRFQLPVTKRPAIECAGCF